MKKIMSLMLASLLVATTLTACQRGNKPKPEDDSSSKAEGQTYTDGEYSVRYNEMALDRTLDYLTISVQGDEVKIKEYGMKEGGAEGGDASAASSEEMTEAEQKAVQHSNDILDEYDNREGDLDAMEPVKDAEEHTYRFIRMMRTALESAKSGDTAEVTLNRYADGKYESVMPDFNPKGWKEYVRVTVKDGKLSDLEYNATSEKDSSKLITEDADANKGENPPKEIYPQVVKNFQESGEDLTQMTISDTTFQKLMNPLIASMISGGSKNVTASRLVDGEYKAIFADFDEYGWKDYVVLKIRNGKVTVKEFDAVNKTDEKKLKSEDTATDSQMKEKTGITIVDATKDLKASFAKAENDVTKVDNVAGATISSNNFKLLVGQLLATVATSGPTEAPLEVERMKVE